MASKQSTSITVVKGKTAAGKIFGFCYAASTPDDPKVGSLEVGATPVKVDLTTPEAKKADLYKTIMAYVAGGYLAIVADEEEEPQPAKRGRKKQEESEDAA